MKLRHRGPDRSALVNTPLTYGSMYDVIMGFHRLAVMDISVAGMQPMSLPEYPGVTVVCNGEIYNWRELATEYGYTLRSECDVETILHLYSRLGFSNMMSRLDGYYALVLHDALAGRVYAARDPQGSRPLFTGTIVDGGFAFASEAKSLVGICTEIEQMSPDCYMIRDTNGEALIRRREEPINTFSTDIAVIKESIRDVFTKAVNKRASPQRPIACLLSGGLDSSLVAALLMRQLGRLRTFSVGFSDTADLRYAREVAAYIGSDHTELLLTEEDFLRAIPAVIDAIESYDITSVRASVGNYLVCRHIGVNTDCRVVFNGDYSDEIFMSYQYASRCTDSGEFLEENRKLVREIHHFDSLRSDRCAAKWGLECRTPFADLEFMKLVMTISPDIKMHHNKIEKWILREAFAGISLIPNSVLWRPKCAFSDGVSAKSRPWYKIIQEHADDLVTDYEFYVGVSRFAIHTPTTKESYWYRTLYDKKYRDVKCIPHFWMPNPKWTSSTDPSARSLSFNKE